MHNNSAILFSELSYEIKKSKLDNVNVQLYKSGKIRFTDRNENFSVIINNFDDAKKVASKYGMANFGIGRWLSDRKDDIRSGLEEVGDRFKDKTGIKEVSQKAKGSAKQVAANKLQTISSTMKINKKELEDLANDIKKYSKADASRIKKIANDGNKMIERSQKLAQKISKSTAIKTEKKIREKENEYLNNLKNLEIQYREASDNIRESEDGLKEAETVIMEVSDVIKGKGNIKKYFKLREKVNNGEELTNDNDKELYEKFRNYIDAQDEIKALRKKLKENKEKLSEDKMKEHAELMKRLEFLGELERSDSIEGKLLRSIKNDDDDESEIINSSNLIKILNSLNFNQGGLY